MKRYTTILSAIICATTLSFSTLQAQTAPTLATDSSVITLDSCLALARQNNKSLRSARLDIEKAQEVKNQAFTKYFPQIKASAAGYHALQPMIDVGVNDIANASARNLLSTLYYNYGAALGLSNHISMFGYGYMAGVTAVQPVYMGGKIVAGNRLAKVGVEAAQLQTEIAERDLLEQVEESYWLVVGLTEKQQTLASVTALLDTIHHTVATAVDAGLALKNDLLQVELRQSEMQRTAIQLRNGISLAQRALCQSIGLEYDEKMTLDTTALCPNDTLHSNSAEEISAEEQLLALQVRAAEYDRRMTIADALPQVAVGAHYGYSRLQTNLVENGFGNERGNGAIFVSLSVPLTAWWETAHKIREKNIALEQAQLQQDETNELLALRNQQAYDKMTESYLLMGETRRAVDIANENYRLSVVNYRAGTSTITDLLSAQSALLQAKNNLTDAIIAYRVNLRRYNDLTK